MIKVDIVKYSVDIRDHEVITYLLEYPRFIHTHVLTHRMLSKNSASSRAIPTESQIKYAKENMVYPIHWGLNQKGMQADKEVEDPSEGIRLWEHAADACIESAREMAKGGEGFHKQIANRMLEWFSPVRVVLSATELNNFFHLRCHKDAQPEIRELARLMWQAKKNAKPQFLPSYGWHVPFVGSEQVRKTSEMRYFDLETGDELSWKDACRVSASCCAQESYRKKDTSLEKAKSIYKNLIESKPLHSSPFEHVCKPFSLSEYLARKACQENLISTMSDTRMIDDKTLERMVDSLMFDGNFRGYTQFRKLLEGENMTAPWSPEVKYD